MRMRESETTELKRSTGELAENIPDVTESGVKYSLTVLRGRGFLQRIGHRRGGHWRVLRHDWETKS